MVSTLDFESSDPSSNLGGTCFPFFSMIFKDLSNKWVSKQNEKVYENALALNKKSCIWKKKETNKKCMKNILFWSGRPTTLHLPKRVHCHLSYWLFSKCTLCYTASTSTFIHCTWEYQSTMSIRSVNKVCLPFQLFVCNVLSNIIS